MKKVIYLFVFTAFLLQLQVAEAALGDATPQEEEPIVTDVTAPGTFGSEDKFSRDNFSNNEQIMDAGDGTDPPPMPDPNPPIPLDGGASLLLIGGIGLGIRKLFGKKK